MASPVTVSSFLECVSKCGLIDTARLNSFLENRQLPADPVALAAGFVRENLLTKFQAKQLLRGKHRGFFIGKYKLLDRIGSGGMGSVFLAEHVTMRRRVAIKVLPPDKAGEGANLERFFREARAAAVLDHPNIIRAYDLCHEDEIHFLVMEYAEGKTLDDVLTKQGPLPVGQAAHIIVQVTDGLQHAHQAGLVHRDIKPANLLVDRKGLVKILDMGLARFLEDDKDQLTRRHDEGLILGTADFLAPEQAINSTAADIRSDIYSLGATFYTILAGRPPFEAKTVTQKLLMHQMRMPTPIESLRPDLPLELAAVITRMMAKKPDERFQTPLEVRTAVFPWAMPATHFNDAQSALDLNLEPATSSGISLNGVSLRETLPLSAKTTSIPGLIKTAGSGPTPSIKKAGPSVPGASTSGSMTPFGVARFVVASTASVFGLFKSTPTAAAKTKSRHAEQVVEEAAK